MRPKETMEHDGNDNTNYIGCTLLLLLSFYSCESFTQQWKLTYFQESLSDIRFPEVSKTLLSILADFSNAVVSFCTFTS